MAEDHTAVAAVLPKTLYVLDARKQGTTKQCVGLEVLIWWIARIPITIVSID